MAAREMLEGIAGYPGLFAFCALSGIAFPVPEDVSLLYAGMRVESGAWSWAPTIAVAAAGVLTRDLVAYGVGRALGRWVLGARFVVTMVGKNRLDRARALVRRHGSRAVLFGRFMIGLRAPVFLVAGAVGTPVSKFVAWDLVGLAVTVPGVIVAGAFFGPPLVDVVFAAAQSSQVVLPLVLGVIALAWFAWSRLRKPPVDSVNTPLPISARPVQPGPDHD